MNCYRTTDAMRPHKFHILSLMMLVLLASCTRMDPDSSGLPQAVVDIRASLDESVPETKALVDFSSATEYGIFTCISMDNVPAPTTPYETFKPSIWNAQARGSGSTWTYKNVASYATGELYAAGGNVFILFGRNDNLTADLYAYAPWKQAAYNTGPTAIPFSRNENLMYAVQNTSRANNNLNPASLGSLSANFDFRHVMARLIFRFRLQNDNTTMSVALSSIRNNAPAGGTAVLYTSGTFNAIDGSLNDKHATDELTNVGSCTAYYTDDPAVYHAQSAIDFTLVPTDIAVDDELTFIFSSGGFKFPFFVLKRDWVKHAKANPGDPDVYGFKAGYTYTFYFTLDNYVRFDGFNIQSWGDLEEDTLTHGVI